MQRLPGGSVVAAAVVVGDAGQQLSLQTEGHQLTILEQYWAYWSRQGEALFSDNSRINKSL